MAIDPIEDAQREQEWFDEMIREGGKSKCCGWPIINGNQCLWCGTPTEPQ